MSKKPDLLQDILIEVMNLESSSDRLFDLIVEVRDGHLDQYYGDLSKAIDLVKVQARRLQEAANPTQGTSAGGWLANAQPINESEEKT